MAKDMKWIGKVAKFLVAISAINWGLIAWFNFNLVTALFGNWPFVVIAIYTLIAVSGVWRLIELFR